MSVSKLTQIAAMLALVLYGLASMHCTLEGVPGFEFLKSCCFVDAESSAPSDCEGDGCGPVEHGKYRPEEQTVSVPQPLLIAAFVAPVIQASVPEPLSAFLAPSESPPGLSKPWQFSYRTALSPRAPSAAS